MKYKNIIFDFGNVLGTFNGDYILKQFSDSAEDRAILAETIFPHWPDLDRGVIDYDETMEQAVALVPEHLKGTVRDFFAHWFDYVPLIQPTCEFIAELKQAGAGIYLLSNAPTRFVEWAMELPILKEFDGIVFSAPLKMAKPDPEIYRHLFQTYGLDPKDCFFIDDLEANIRTAREEGMDGIVFKGDLEEVRRCIEL